MAAGLHISLSAEPIFTLSGLTITNSIITGWLVSGFLVLFSLWFYNTIKVTKFSDKPSRLQSFVELIIEGLYGLVKSVAISNQKARIFFPLIATFFLFIILSNWSGLLPGVGTIGFREKTHAQEGLITEDPIHAKEEPAHMEKATLEKNKLDTEIEAVSNEDFGEKHEPSFVPYFRAPTADINTTLALAIFSVASIQVIGFKFLGFEYPTKFINFKDPIKFFVGILEAFLELAKIFSFAFRLFGNIFAGEVLLAVIAFLMPIIAPLPFIGLELFVGFIQALVFSMLTLVFLNIATVSHAQH